MFFIDIEGPDCSFKDTIMPLVAKHLEDEFKTKTVKILNGIDYESESSYYIRKLLDGYFGRPYDVAGMTTATIFALHRLDMVYSDWFKDLYNSDKVILLTNRWTLSNAIYQSNLTGRRSPLDESLTYPYQIWNYEHEELGIPVPDMVITLVQDINLAKDILSKREGKQDKIESDYKYLEATYEKFNGMIAQDYVESFKLKQRWSESVFCYKIEERDKEGTRYHANKRTVAIPKTPEELAIDVTNKIFELIRDHMTNYKRDKYQYDYDFSFYDDVPKPGMLHQLEKLLNSKESGDNGKNNKLFPPRFDK